jgi:hypothetical protein
LLFIFLGKAFLFAGLDCYSCWYLDCYSSGRFRWVVQLLVQGRRADYIVSYHNWDLVTNLFVARLVMFFL